MQNSAFFFIATSWQRLRRFSIKSGDPGFVEIDGPDVIGYPELTAIRCIAPLEISRAIPMSNCCSSGSTARAGVSVSTDAPRFWIVAEAIGRHFGARLVVRIQCDIYPNCPRYVPDIEGARPSPYVPRPGRGDTAAAGVEVSATTSATSCLRMIRTRPWSAPIARRKADTPGLAAFRMPAPRAARTSSPASLRRTRPCGRLGSPSSAPRRWRRRGCASGSGSSRPRAGGRNTG